MKLVCTECKRVYIMEESPEKLSLTYCPRCGTHTTLTKYTNKRIQKLNAWRWKHKKVDVKEIIVRNRIKTPGAKITRIKITEEE